MNENFNVLKIDYLKFENIAGSKVYANVNVGLNMEETDIRGESNPGWELNTEFLVKSLTQDELLITLLDANNHSYNK